MQEKVNLSRFLDAQKNDYQTALKEIKSGRKRSHWMWYIFPQIEGLGLSSTAVLYSIKNMEEASAYLHHPVLGSRLQDITETLLSLPEDNATAILGSPDDLKLKSCMTLFSQIPDGPAIFKQVLNKFFGGQPDHKTLQILHSQTH